MTTPWAGTASAATAQPAAPRRPHVPYPIGVARLESMVGPNRREELRDELRHVVEQLDDPLIRWVDHRRGHDGSAVFARYDGAFPASRSDPLGQAPLSDLLAAGPGLIVSEEHGDVAPRLFMLDQLAELTREGRLYLEAVRPDRTAPTRPRVRSLPMTTPAADQPSDDGTSGND